MFPPSSLYTQLSFNIIICFIAPFPGPPPLPDNPPPYKSIGVVGGGDKYLLCAIYVSRMLAEKLFAGLQTSSYDP